MTIKTFYPNTLTYTNGENYVAFSGINNLKNASKTYATTNEIGKTTDDLNQPAPITATNFKISLPAGAEIQKIKVEIAHQLKSNDVNIPKPTISLVNTAGKETGNLSAPTTTLKNVAKSFYYDQDLIDEWLVNYAKTHKNTTVLQKLIQDIKKSSSIQSLESLHVDFNAPKKYKINQAKIVGNVNFGVKISYPPNTSKKTGVLKLQYIRVVVKYKFPSYSLVVKEYSTSSRVIDSQFKVKITLSNKNLTSYNPTVMIQLPVSVSYNSCSGDGVITVGQETRLNWNPELTSKKSKSSVILIFDNEIVSKNQKLIVTELYSNKSKSVGFDITSLPASTSTETYDDASTGSDNDSDSEESTSIIQMIHEGEDITVFVTLPSGTVDSMQSNDYVFFKIYRGSSDITSYFKVGSISLSSKKYYANDFEDNMIEVTLTPQIGASNSKKSLITIAPILHDDGNDVLGL